MNLIYYNTVFCDWLDITYSPEDDIIPDLVSFLGASNFITKDRTFDLKQSYYPEGDGNYGSIVFEVRSTFVRVSASGGAISFLRGQGLFPDYLALLSQSPHTVTRLDAAFDVSRDFPTILHGLRSHHKGYASFTRKQYKVRELLSVRDDGKKSGTYYIGSPRGRISGRIYDKQLEMLEKRKLRVDTCTRYEVTFRKGVTLKDALNPEPLFWAHADVLKIGHLKPSGVSDWVDGSDFTGWTYERPEKTAYAKLARRVEVSGCLTDLINLADDFGPEGRTVLLRLISKRLDDS